MGVRRTRPTCADDGRAKEKELFIMTESEYYAYPVQFSPYCAFKQAVTNYNDMNEKEVAKL